jgi:DNA-binding ferritin-like protein (Dps family)
MFRKAHKTVLILIIAEAFLWSNACYSNTLRVPLDSSKYVQMESLMGYYDLEQNLLWNNPLMQKIIDAAGKEGRSAHIKAINSFLLFHYDLSEETMKEIKQIKQEIDLLSNEEKIERGNRYLAAQQHTGAKPTFKELIKMTISGEEAEGQGGGFLQVIGDKIGVFADAMLRKYDNPDRRSMIVSNFDWLYTAISVVHAVSEEAFVENNVDEIMNRMLERITPVILDKIGNRDIYVTKIIERGFKALKEKGNPKDTKKLLLIIEKSADKALMLNSSKIIEESDRLCKISPELKGMGIIEAIGDPENFAPVFINKTISVNALELNPKSQQYKNIAEDIYNAVVLSRAYRMFLNTAVQEMPYLDAFIEKLTSPDHNVRAQAMDFYLYVLHSIFAPAGNNPGREYLIAKLKNILKEANITKQSTFLLYGTDPTDHINRVVQFLYHDPERGTRPVDHSNYMHELIEEISMSTIKRSFTFRDKVKAIIGTGSINVLIQLKDVLLKKLEESNNTEPEIIGRLKEALKIVDEEMPGNPRIINKFLGTQL